MRVQDGGKHFHLPYDSIMFFMFWLNYECVFLIQVLQLQPDEGSDLLGLQLLSHLLLLAGFTGLGALPGCFRSR